MRTPTPWRPWPRMPAGGASSPAPTARTSELLAANGAIDFGDQVSLALRLLRDSPSAREQIQQRFRYVLVDEFQDTNRAQAELVALVAQRHRNVTVVGDDDQSIYKFRGAAISNILEFRERYRNARVVVLRRNYRSRAAPSSMPPIAWSVTTTRTGSRSRRGSSRSSSRSAAPTTRRPSATRCSRRARRRRTGSPGTSPAGSARGRRRTTSRSWSGRTPRRTPCSAR